MLLNKIALAGNKSTYIKIPENKEKTNLEKINHKIIIEEKIIPNLINVDAFKVDFESTIPLIPRPHCNTMFMVNPE
jgi:hypothetical protein